jgi:hypothetical protein
MTKAQYGLVLVLAILSGLLGGMGAGMIAGPITSQVFSAKFLRAKRFEVVDKRGKILASLDESGLTFFEHEGAGIPVALDTASSRLKLLSSGRLIELNANSLSLTVYDSDGKLVWKIPPAPTQPPTQLPSSIPLETQP